MFRINAALLGIVVFASPASAQDSGVLGNIDPGAWVSGHTMPMAIDAQVRENRRASRRGGDGVSDRTTCSQVPRYQAAFGARDRRIVRLKQLCRQAGLPTGR